MKRLLLTGMLASVSSSGLVHAACMDLGAPGCLQESLQHADDELNALYARILESSSPANATALRADQRSWIRQRDANCGLAASSTTSTDWISTLAREPTKATCVYGSVTFRLNQLRARQSALREQRQQLLEKRETTFPATRRSGKWYAEFVFVTAAYGRTPGQMQAGAIDGVSFRGVDVPRSTMARDADPSGRYTIGFAMDLDNGKYYTASNGDWLGAVPGSAEGLDLVRGKSHTLRLTSSGPSISTDLDLGAIRINTGQQPFRYPMPAGYRPYFSPASGDASARQLDWMVPAYEKVQGKSYDEWVSRFWAWTMTRKPGRKATDDATGQFCGDDQAGPVWFLATADARSNIVRRCTIPAGRHLLVPAIAQVFNSKTGAEQCPGAEKLARQGVAAIESSYVVIDGERFDSLYDYQLFSEHCASIRGSLGDVILPDAAFFGTWVLLRPLPPGEHVISFGGTLPALNANRAVTYRLRVE